MDEVCRVVLTALPDAVVLHEICDQLEEYISQGPSLQASLGPLQQTWNQMYHKALSSYRTTIQYKTSHLMQGEQDDFLHMLSNAKKLFVKTPSGAKQFNEIISSIRKSKSLRKDLVQKIVKSLASHRPDGAPVNNMF